MSQAATNHLFETEDESPRSEPRIQRPPLAIALEDGSRAEMRDGAVELRDAEDRLVARFHDGALHIEAPRDLELAAPHGRIRFVAGTDIELEASRDIIHRGGRRVTLEAAKQQLFSMSPQRTHLAASKLHVEAKESRLSTSKAVLFARQLSTTAERVASKVERYELTARTVVEKTRDAFRTVLGLDQHRVGRQKTIASDTVSLHAGRTVIVSKRDTSIDGERVLLG